MCVENNGTKKYNSKVCGKGKRRKKSVRRGEARKKKRWKYTTTKYKKTSSQGKPHQEK